MKILGIITLMLSLTACDADSFSRSRATGAVTQIGVDQDGQEYSKTEITERLRVSERPSGHGVTLAVQNFLATKKPHLSVRVCSYINNPQKDHEVYCLVSDELIGFMEKKTFEIRPEELEKMTSRGDDIRKITVSYNDTHSMSSVHWECWEHRHLNLPENEENVEFNIAVTQSNTASYSCTVETIIWKHDH